MKFYLKYFLLGLLIVFVFNYKLFLGIDTEAEVPPQKVALQVERGTIKESIEVVGSAELVDEQQLGFNIAGTVTKVNVKPGDSVKKGDIIAEIDNTDAYNTIRDAQISLDNARISLTQLYEGPDDSQVMSSQNNITTSENALTTATKELENLKISQENTVTKQLEDIDNSKKELDSLKATLELSKNELEILIKEKSQSLDNTISNKSTTIKNAEESFKTYLVELEKMLLEADYVLGVTEKNARLNDDYEIYLGAKNSNYKAQASTLLLKSLTSFDTLSKNVNAYNNSGDRDDIIEILNEFKNMYNEIYEMEDALFRTGENSIVSSSFSQTQIDSIKTNATTARNTSLTKINTINTTINTLNTLSDTDLIINSNQNAIATKEESIKSQELSITKQQNTINNLLKTYQETVASQKVTLKSKENDVESKRNALEIAKTSYEELVKGPTAENIKKQQNAITQAQIRIENAQKSLDDYKLEAPFDGIVRKIDYMVGDNLKNDTDKYVYLENPDLVEIIVKLDQIDIVTVNVGNSAIITFDAYPNKPANAKINLIDTTPIVTSGVVSYEVKLVLDDDNFDKTLLSGMTANIEIITEQKDNVLLLNTQAINSKEGKKYVSLLKDRNTEETTEVEVVTGMASDGKTEIISGLDEGDIVIYERITFTASSTAGMMQMGGGGGGGAMMIR